MLQTIVCDLCQRPVPAHAHYIVRIEVLADPSLPPLTQKEIDECDFDETLRELLAQMKDMTAEELQDQVYRKLEFRLCRLCQIRYLANPLGKPRERREGQN